MGVTIDKSKVIIADNKSLMEFRTKKLVLNFRITRDERLETTLIGETLYLKLQNTRTKKLEQAVVVKTPSLTIKQPFGFSFDYCWKKSEILVSVNLLEINFSAHMVPIYRNQKYEKIFKKRIESFLLSKILGLEEIQYSNPKSIIIEVNQMTFKFLDMDDF